MANTRYYRIALIDKSKKLNKEELIASLIDLAKQSSIDLADRPIEVKGNRVSSSTSHIFNDIDINKDIFNLEVICNDMTNGGDLEFVFTTQKGFIRFDKDKYSNDTTLLNRGSWNWIKRAYQNFLCKWKHNYLHLTNQLPF